MSGAGTTIQKKTKKKKKKRTFEKENIDKL
jgi:hypothetical protein